MPCGAIAFEQARIFIEVNGELSKQAAAVLNVEVAAKLLNAAMQQMGKTVRIIRDGDGLQVIGSDFTVNYARSGKITVKGRAYSKEESEKIAGEVRAAVMKMLTQGAGLLLQVKAQQLLSKALPVESVQHAANGTIVLHVEI